MTLFGSQSQKHNSSQVNPESELMENYELVTSKERDHKHHCLKCELLSYDLARTPTICPNCGERFNPEARIVSNSIDRTQSVRYPAAHGLGGWASQRPQSKPTDVVARSSQDATELEAIKRGQDEADGR